MLSKRSATAMVAAAARRNTTRTKLILDGKKDVYGGITVDMTQYDHMRILPRDLFELQMQVQEKQQQQRSAQKTHEKEEEEEYSFQTVLEDSVKEWLERGVRGVWLKLPADTHARLAADAIACGFELHHATKQEIYLTKWLPAMKENGEVSKLPEFSSHYLGCGGLVVDLEKGRVLLMTERYQILSAKQQMWRPIKDNSKLSELKPWKIPGGTLDLGEDIAETAIREVFEETGVKSNFLGVIGYRHMHNFRFGQGDIYFVCLLRALQNDLKPDPREVSECQWFSIEEYLEMDHLNKVQTAAQTALKQLIDDHNGQLKDIEKSDRLIRMRDVSQFEGRRGTWYSSLS